MGRSILGLIQSGNDPGRWATGLSSRAPDHNQLRATTALSRLGERPRFILFSFPFCDTKI
jgi:hypothetical protein